MAQGSKGQTVASAAPVNGVSSNHAPVPAGVNRKKQKRREKLAAKQAAEALKQDASTAKNGHPPQPQPAKKHLPAGQPAPTYTAPEHDEPDHFDPADGDDYSDEEGHGYRPTFGANGNYDPAYANPSTNTGTGKKSKKKKKANAGAQHAHDDSHLAQHQPSHAQSGSRRSNNKDRIWNTSTSEERERIKEFWLSLGEDERKSLVKIEKEAVLRKMKEQQKHSCSCTVCGRKRTAIEEELEVLYDAYYEELEQYANHQQDGTPMLPPPSRYAQTLSSMPPGRHMMTTHPPSRLQELADEDSEEEDEDDVEEEEYSDEDDDDYLSEDEPMDLPRGTATDFFNFGNSLTVKGGILTVADDLLKNDGKKFIEMMEQLAERRMQREEEAQFAASNLGHPSMYSKAHGHSHGAPPEEEEYDDEEEEDYDDEEEYEDDEEDDRDTMTEEQRMEEGRRMFQIFAARMFEQRVLTAYREKVAAERQARLLEELAEEDEKKDQREAKKAKEAQKRKEKKEKQKAAKAEEKARKEAEKAAQEAAAKAAEEKRLEEQRKKKEEQRKKKEMERKAQEEERQRKEAERLKRQQEERERQQEAERKAREQKALEKKAREEAKKKEREEREAREKEAREKKAQEEKERREREAKSKAEKERVRKEEQAAAVPIAPSRKSSQPVVPVALPPGLLKQNSSTGVPSPLVTPAIPKAPTPNRPRQSSQQGSHGSSPKTPQVAPGTGKSMSPAHGVAHGNQTAAPRQILTKASNIQQPLPMHHPQPASPMHPIGPPPGMQPPTGMGMPGIPPGLNGFPHAQGPMIPGMMGQRHPNLPMYPPPPSSQAYRPFPPPGMHAPNPLPIGRGFMDGPPGFPGIGVPNSMAGFGMGIPAHSRQASGSFDKQAGETPIAAPQAQPIARPTPIQRPSSVKPHDEHRQQHGSDVDDLANHLGSKALLGDDEPELQPVNEGRRISIRAPGANPLGFGFAEGAGPPRGEGYPPFGSLPNANSTWGTPPMGFPMGPGPGWGNSPTAGLFTNPFLGGPRHTEQPREVVLRKILCSTCKILAAQRPSSDGYYDLNEIYEYANANRGPADPTFTAEDLLNVCDIFGNNANGGGSLETREVPPGSNQHAIRFEESGSLAAAPGEIGSPLPGHSVPANGGFGARPFGSVHSPNF